MLFSVNFLILAATCFVFVYTDYKCGYKPVQHNYYPLELRSGYKNRMIINGRHPMLNELPFVAYIDVKWKQGWSCTGSILSSKHILTAFHCVKTMDNQTYEDIQEVVKEITVTVGSQWKDVGQFFKVEWAQSTKKAFTNDFDDIVILKLKGDINFNYLDAAPVCLAQVPPLNDENLIIAGHGASVHRGRINTHFNSYIIGDVTVLRDSEYFSVPNTEFIAGGMNRGVYYGDSGGPAVRIMDDRYYQVGIISTTLVKVLNDGRDILNQGSYVSISVFCDFIHKKTEGIAYCQ